MVLLSRSFQFWFINFFSSSTFSFIWFAYPRVTRIYPACSSERFLNLCLEFSTIQDKIHFLQKFFLLLFPFSETEMACILNHLTLSHRSLSFLFFSNCFSLYTSVYKLSCYIFLLVDLFFSYLLFVSRSEFFTLSVFFSLRSSVF